MCEAELEFQIEVLSTNNSAANTHSGANTNWLSAQDAVESEFHKKISRKISIRILEKEQDKKKIDV